MKINEYAVFCPELYEKESIDNISRRNIFRLNEAVKFNFISDSYSGEKLYKDYQYWHARDYVQINEGRFLLVVRDDNSRYNINCNYSRLFRRFLEQPDISVEHVQLKHQINDNNLKNKFETLTKKWKDETQFASTVLEMAIHPAYQQIIGMGPSVIPLILHSLRIESDHWFWALKSISGEDPVPEHDRGNISKMTEAWLKWGRNLGYELQRRENRETVPEFEINGF